jgi:L-ascorbate metabolism protein UlaG (beta-lactamase superfamily)
MAGPWQLPVYLCEGKRILLDTWLHTNPKCPGKYRKKGGFQEVDLILWTHGHVDHFMLPDGKDLISQYQPRVLAPWDLSFFIKSEIPEAKCQTFTLANKGATASFDGINVIMTEAFHSSGAQLTGFEGNVWRKCSSDLFRVRRVKEEIIQ